MNREINQDKELDVIRSTTVMSWDCIKSEYNYESIPWLRFFKTPELLRYVMIDIRNWIIPGSYEDSFVYAVTSEKYGVIAGPIEYNWSVDEKTT